MTLHNSLTGLELHEPKGVAAASEGAVYVADGVGSGTWKYSPTGYGRYKGTNTLTFTTTPTKLLCNGLGTATTEDHLPREIRGTRGLWNVASNKITPIAEGDAYITRLDLPITAKTGSPTVLTLSLDIGTGVSPTNVILVEEVSTLKATPYTLSTTINFDTLATFLANGGQIFATTDTGTVTIVAPSIQITRVHGEV